MSLPPIKQANVADIADAMRRDHNPKQKKRALGRTVLLVGAGCSVSAGIPLASAIAKELVCKLADSYSAWDTSSDDADSALRVLVQKGKFPEYLLDETKDAGEANWADVYDHIFSHHYRTPKETRAIFTEFLERSGQNINYAHLCVGELVRLGYVSTVLTTNFDQLALEGIARTGRLPVVADGLESLYRISGDSNYPQLIQIHGSRHTYYLRNSSEDTDLVAEDAAARHAIDELLRAASVVIIVGYGGRERGLMQLLTEAGRRWPDTQIFWVAHSSKLSGLGDQVQSLLQTSRFAAAVLGQDADDFFNSLLVSLGHEAPRIIDDPLYIVKDLQKNLIYSENQTITGLIEKHKHKVREIEALSLGELPVPMSNNDKLNEQILQAQKMSSVGQLAGGIAHDFNNILQAIIGYSDLLLASHRPTDHAFPDIMQIKQNANRGASLVRQLLAFSRRQTFQLEEVDLVEVLSDLLMLLRRLIGERIDLIYDHPSDIWSVLADVNQIEQVIVNLVVNARDAMPMGGRLTIRTANISGPESDKLLVGPDNTSARGVDCVLVEVSDTGEGVPPDIIDKIFEPFFTTKEIGKGTGLGLSTVFGIVKQLGGAIDVQSKLNESTTFHIYLPRYIKTKENNPKKAIIVEPDKKISTQLTASGTILIVEDEDPVRAANSRALKTRGYQVLEASSGQAALEIIRQKINIDLVISNVMMPNMTGVELLRITRSIIPNQRFILVSGYPIESFERDMSDMEFEFLPKPFSLTQLVEAVKGRFRDTE